MNYKIGAIVAGIALGGILTSCKKERPKPVPTSFETMTVEKKDIKIPVKFSARLKGQADVTITPQVSGQLTQICVSEGQQVRKGQTLFVIDSRAAEQELKAALANLEVSQAQESSARLEYKSNKNLYEKKIVSDYMLENAENAYRKAKAAVSQAEAAVSSAKVRLGFCTVTAPVSGLIGEIPVRSGDQVSPATLLTVLSGNAMLNAEFALPESMLLMQLNAGFSIQDKEKRIAEFPDVTFVLTDGTEFPHKGRISSLTGVVDPTTGSLACKATFPNPEGLPLSGVQGTVVVPYAKKDVMVIPQDAVVLLQNKSIVYKVKPDSTVTATTVKTQNIGDGDMFAVLSGLNVGDRIVTIGANNLQEGQKVIFPAMNGELKK